MTNHASMTLIGSALPLLLIFLLPTINVTGGWLLVLGMVAMFISHVNIRIQNHARKGSAEREHAR